MTLTCDDLVIGSGAGGAVTAAVLARGGRDVIVAEDGPEPRAKTLPQIFSSLWRSGGAIPIRSNATLTFGEGRCVGGSTVLNAGLTQQISEGTLNEWHSIFELKDLTYDELLSLHQEIEKRLEVTPLHRPSRLHSGTEVPVAHHKNKNGIIKNTASVFLTDATTYGARILPDHYVVRISTNNSGAHAAILANGNTITCKRVFVCAGAIQTPLLLQRSGIRRNIGNTLELHPMLKVAALFRNSATDFIMPSEQIRLTDEITLGSSLSLPAYSASVLATNWPLTHDHMKDLARIETFYVALSTRTRGSVRLLPLTRVPNISYMLSSTDIARFKEGLDALSKLLLLNGAQKLFFSVERTPPASTQDDIPSLTTASKLVLNTVHATSSCPMGERDDAACDSYGRLKQFSTIYINDASMLPTSPHVNPQGPIMALALRNARHALSAI